MKKALFIPIIVALFLFACKQEHSQSIAPSTKKYKVSFHISNFTQKQGNFALKRNPRTLALGDTITNLSSYLDVLYLQVYDQQDRPVNTLVVQDSTMANMGMITDSLPAGIYKVYVVAGKKGLTLTNYNIRSFEGFFGYGGLNWQDTFWAGATITVGTTDMSQELTMNRVVGKVRLHVLDNIPANADSMAMTLTPETSIMLFDRGYNMGESGGATRIAVKIPASAKGHPDFIMDKIVGSTFDPFSVDIRCTDASNNVIAHASVDNVRTGANIVSVLSGNLFASPPGLNPQSFTVKVDTAWNSTVNHQGF